MKQLCDRDIRPHHVPKYGKHPISDPEIRRGKKRKKKKKEERRRNRMKI